MSTSLVDLSELDYLLERAKVSLQEKKESVISFQERDREQKKIKRPNQMDMGVNISSMTYLQKKDSSKYAPVGIKPELEVVVNDPHAPSGPESSSKIIIAEPLTKVTVPSLQKICPKSLDYTKEQKKRLVQETTGPGWFDMAAPDLTDEIKRDLHLLRNRAALDPKRHYKKNTMTALPKFFQVGTVIDNGSSRVERQSVKVKKRSIVEELMADRQARQRLKKKYLEIQEKKNNVTRKKRFNRNLKKR